ncbi:hypothetical protein IMG5_122920 [Ichthyophthirius multifiliis]|uniref:Uncharacterized protein n=1 Tax=Ichthyophthirius multifiliis TaxID=5932 RepID=G0QVD1_ICHMU|nr:hypothetical protein IMG5_122920 [Ichthyophthirius multifiliis]EGR30820.1 hypothetical protein IMG5_122920 [Ichthyophthirius multifiliis]|eukprot:XP_004032407.1 hypothetical protein IMG5_122920 [Ichthyophthirius multifiliis]
MKQSFDLILKDPFIQPEDRQVIQTDYDLIFSQDISIQSVDTQIIQTHYDLISSQNKVNKLWQLPDSWHTTVLYIGSNIEKAKTEYYLQFKEGQHVDLNGFSFFYVPGRIICTPDKPKDVLIENKIPHMTLLMGNWAAVSSNYLLEKMFLNNGPLQQEYNNGEFFQLGNNTIVKKFFQLNINDENVDVFMVKSNFGIYLDGVNTKVFMENSEDNKHIFYK